MAMEKAGKAYKLFPRMSYISFAHEDLPSCLNHIMSQLNESKIDSQLATTKHTLYIQTLINSNTNIESNPPSYKNGHFPPKFTLNTSYFLQHNPCLLTRSGLFASGC